MTDLRKALEQRAVQFSSKWGAGGNHAGMMAAFAAEEIAALKAAQSRPVIAASDVKAILRSEVYAELNKDINFGNAVEMIVELCGAPPAAAGREDERDAIRYRRLRVLGCAPYGTKQLDQASVLRFTGLDEVVDADLSWTPSRGEASTVTPQVLGAGERLWCTACGTVTRDQTCDCNRYGAGHEMYREPNFVNYADAMQEAAREQSCRAHVAETALEEIRRYSDENLGPSRSSLLNKIAATADAALALTRANRSPAGGGE